MRAVAVRARQRRQGLIPVLCRVRIEVSRVDEDARPATVGVGGLLDVGNKPTVGLGVGVAPEPRVRQRQAAQQSDPASRFPIPHARHVSVEGGPPSRSKDHSASYRVPGEMSRSKEPFPSFEEPARLTPVRYETEVLVVGGGSAGVAAAVAAARNGADVLLVERYGYLGGLATAGLIILLLTLDDGRGRQVIAGLCEEVTDRLKKRGAAYFPPREEWGSSDEAKVRRDQRWGLVWGHGPHSVRYSVAYEPEDMKFAFNQMIEESGVQLLFHAWACDPILENERLQGVVFHGKSGRFAVRASVVIDATGDGDVFAAAGCQHESEEVLPWLWFTMGGVKDVAAAIDAGAGCFRTIGDGKVLFPWGATEKVSRRIDATSPEDLTYAELECRKRVMAGDGPLAPRDPGVCNRRISAILRISWASPRAEG